MALAEFALLGRCPGLRGCGFLALEDGLVLTHHQPEHAQEVGVLLTLGAAFHGGLHGICIL